MWFVLVASEVESVTRCSLGGSVRSASVSPSCPAPQYIAVPRLARGISGFLDSTGFILKAVDEIIKRVYKDN